MENRYITQGALAALPSWLQNLLWYLRHQIPQKDYLQIFTLSRYDTGQRILLSQEEPPYTYSVDVPCEDPVCTKVFITHDVDHVTMLLAEEY